MSSRADFSDRRQIIVFFSSGSASGVLTQRLVDDLRCQLVERDTDVRFVDIAELPDTISATENRDEPSLLHKLVLLRSEERLDFEMVLIGKDGGVKARTDNPEALNEFLAMIDTMPMRRAEIRSRGKADCQ
ncbi:MAG: DUF4174 domain-containing protein [Granulosicoccus sp.]